MTTTPMPGGFDVCAMPLSETATIGAVLISPVERAQRILASYENEDITEPRLKMIDRVARYLVAQDTAANMAAVAAAAEHNGAVTQSELPTLWLLIHDVVDENTLPQIHDGKT